MAETEFEILAAKVLAGEASAGERRRLEELLAQDTSLRAEFAELELARSYVRIIGPLAQALEAQPAPIPEHRLVELQAVVVKTFGREARPQPMREMMAELVLRWSRGYPTAVAGVALIALAVGLSLFFRWPHRLSETRSESSALAYLLSAEGRPEVWREGRSLGFAPILTVRPGDELRLGVGTSIRLLTEHGAFQVIGPKKFALKNLNTNDPAFTRIRAGYRFRFQHERSV